MSHKTPKYTDAHRYPNGPYNDAKASEKPGYLKLRFDRIRAEAARDKAERVQKVSLLKRIIMR